MDYDQVSPDIHLMDHNYFLPSMCVPCIFIYIFVYLSNQYYSSSDVFTGANNNIIMRLINIITYS